MKEGSTDENTETPFRILAVFLTGIIAVALGYGCFGIGHANGQIGVIKEAKAILQASEGRV
jgi:hypothetical protein